MFSINHALRCLCRTTFTLFLDTVLILIIICDPDPQSSQNLNKKLYLSCTYNMINVDVSLLLKENKSEFTQTKFTITVEQGQTQKYYVT